MDQDFFPLFHLRTQITPTATNYLVSVLDYGAIYCGVECINIIHNSYTPIIADFLSIYFLLYLQNYIYYFYIIFDKKMYLNVPLFFSMLILLLTKYNISRTEETAK